MKNKLITCVILLLVCFNYCYSQNKNTSFIEGVWEGNQMGDWKSIYEIIKTKDSYTGISHEYYLGIKETENEITNIDIYDNFIELKQSNGLKLNFTVSENKNLLVSKIELPDTTIELSFRKVNKKQVNGLNPKTYNNYNYKKPQNTNGGWSVAHLNEVMLNKNLINIAIKKLISKEAGIISSVIIAKNNKLVLEEYFYDHDIKTLHPLSSVTKSISSLAVGLAIDKGHIGINDKISKYFPDIDSINQEITIEHVLKMKAGFVDEQELWRESNNVIKAVLSRKCTFNPEEKFHYDNGTSEIIPGIIKASTGVHLDEYLKQNLFEPMLIKKFDWEMYKSNGYPSASGSLRLTPRDMAKIGQLVLNKGIWNNQQIISENWINNMITKHSFVSEDKNGKAWYGYLWWICETKIENKKIEYYFASGYGSKFIFIVPSLHMVVVFSGGNFNKKHFAPFEIFEKYIIKAAL